MHRGAQPLIQQPLSRRPPGGRPARHAPRAASDLQSVGVPGRRSREFRRRRAGPRLARSVNVRADARGGLMEASITLRPGYALPEEEQIAATYQHLLRRLSHQSVVKHFDAYADIDWDADEYRIDPEDPRWELDRKSTRLNSSHTVISYAVFCLKKKKHKEIEQKEQ